MEDIFLGTIDKDLYLFCAFALNLSYAYDKVKILKMMGVIKNESNK